MNYLVKSNVIAIEPDPEAIRSQLERTLASPEFAQAERMSRFLRFIVNQAVSGRTEMLKESIIGVHVYEREPGYDSKADPVVRTEARRLRAKLLEYARSHPQDPLWIQVPKGGYAPEFQRNYSQDAAKPANLVAMPSPAAPSPEAVRQPWIRRHGWLLATIALIAAAGLVAILLLSRPRVYSGLDARPFTSYPGSEVTPSFSPDGQTIAFVWDGPHEGAAQVWLQRVEGGPPRRVTFSGGDDRWPVWSPDAKQLAFVRAAGANRAAIFTIDLSTGKEQLRGEVALPRTNMPRVDWSPDGKYLVTSDRVGNGGSSDAIVLIAIATGERRQITAPPAGIYGDTDAAFSPDGGLIAFRRSITTSNDDLYVARIQNAATTDVRQISFDHHAIEGHAWMPDGEHIIAASARAGGLHNLWMFSLSGDAPQRLTESDVDAVFPAVSRRSGAVAWSRQIFDSNIWALPLKPGASAKPLIASTMLDSGPQLSPDGSSIAFRSDRTGSNEVWVANADGSAARQVTHYGGPLTSAPRWSPDSKMLAFETRLNGNADIMIAAPAGGPIRRFTTEASAEILPSWSRDGKSIYFASNRTGQWQIWKQPVAAGPARQITNHGGIAPFESPDGGFVYYSKPSPVGGIYRVPPEGGVEETLLPDVPGKLWGDWAVGSNGIYFLEYRPAAAPKYAAILFYDMATKERREIGQTTALPVAWDSGMSLSADEQTLYFTQVDREGSNLYIAAALH